MWAKPIRERGAAAAGSTNFMVNSKRSLWVIGAVALSAAFTAHAQESNTVIGPPQLKDFSIAPQRRIVAPPAQPTQTPAPAPPSTAARPPAAEAPARSAPVQSTATRRQAAPTTPVTVAPAAAQPGAAQVEPVALPTAEASAPPPIVPEAAPRVPGAPSDGASIWYYAAPAAVLVLLGLFFLARRRRPVEALAVETVPAIAAPPPRPRPDPIPRPWLELALKAERASFTDAEAELQFELEIANKGGSPARNLRIDVKMFNGGAEQDKEIGAFFRTAGRETTKLNLPVVEAGVTGVIHGRVTLARADMKAMKLDERLLFVPVVAVNALYDWGEGRTGQTSKSYVVGRELQESSDKMGAFRVDQGPRIWRTVGQRPHSLAKRV